MERRGRATLLHYCGIGRDLIEYTVIAVLIKAAGSCPALTFRSIILTNPRYQVGLCNYPALNLKDEIMQQLQYIRDWGGCFVVPTPK